MGCVCCPAREQPPPHRGCTHGRQELDLRVSGSLPAQGAPGFPGSPGLTQLFVLTAAQGMESISATIGGSGTFLRLEGIICIYSLLQTVMLPLAGFPSDYFSTWFCANEQSSGSSEQAEPSPPIYLSCSSQMPFAVSSRK